jgi:hypothetical protein
MGDLCAGSRTKKNAGRPARREWSHSLSNISSQGWGWGVLRPVADD